MRSVRIFANVLCWILVFSLIVGTFLAVRDSFIYALPQPGNDNAFLMDANGFIDPFLKVLNGMVPVAASGLFGLFLLWRRRFSAGWSVVVAAIFVFSINFGIFVYASWFFHEFDPLWAFHDIWWLQPLSILWLMTYVTLFLLCLRAVSAMRKPITLAALMTVLLICGAWLAWLYLASDFTINLPNVFAVLPFAVGCSVLIRFLLIFLKRRTQLATDN